MPFPARRRSQAGTGLRPMIDGSMPACAYPPTTANGSRSSLSAFSADMRSTAAAPSVIPEALAAVTVPFSGSKTGESLRMLSNLASGRGCSSFATTVAPFRDDTVTGDSSASKRPASCAAPAFFWLSSANRSCSSRGMSSSRASFSAVSPISMSESGHRKPSWTIASTTSAWPSRYPRRIFGSRNGSPLMLSVPPATTTSARPSRIASVASRIDFNPDPQAMLTVQAGTAGGMPARTLIWRATFGPPPA